MSEKREDRICASCGLSIPFDARICPYCSSKKTRLVEKIKTPFY